MPFCLRWASGCSPAPAPGPRSHETKAASHGLAPSFRVPRASSGRPTHRLPRSQTVQPGRLPSLRFSAPSAYPRTRQQLGGRVYLARPLALSGFLDLSALSSAANLPALFHAGSAHGVAPFRALFLSCSRTPSPAPPTLLTSIHPAATSPLVHCSSALASQCKLHNGRACGKAPQASLSSGFYSARESATRYRWFRPVGARGSLGFPPSRVFSSAETARLSPSLPSCASLSRT